MRRIEFLNGLIVTAHVDGKVRFYRTTDYGLERTLVAGSETIFGFSEIEDGSLLATGGDKYARVF